MLCYQLDPIFSEGGVNIGEDGRYKTRRNALLGAARVRPGLSRTRLLFNAAPTLAGHTYQISVGSSQFAISGVRRGQKAIDLPPGLYFSAKLEDDSWRVIPALRYPKN
jgi:hypothetical protein